MKWLSNHFEWHAALIIFAFATLVGNWKNHPCVIAAIGIPGFVLFLASARSAYLHKSTALLDQYDQRFDRMRLERKGAAKFLLEERPEAPDGPTGEDDLEDVLSFFEAPLASQLKEGQISARLVHEYFYHWVRLYYQSPVCQRYIKHYRTRESEAYSKLRDLYGKLQDIEMRAIRRDKGECKAEDYTLTDEELKTYLRQEATLRT